jgi:RNA polymerase sigma-70 factor (ECF subfamily)
VGADRLRHVLAIVHFVFSTGRHSLATQRVARVDLADEGLRLARRLAELLPDEPECSGLLALCLAVHARRRSPAADPAGPTGRAGADRSQWDH